MSLSLKLQKNEKVLRLVLPPTPPLTLVLALVLALVFVEENVLKCGSKMSLKLFSFPFKKDH
jgi:hypothetical protein